MYDKKAILTLIISFVLSVSSLVALPDSTSVAASAGRVFLNNEEIHSTRLSARLTGTVRLAGMVSGKSSFLPFYIYLRRNGKIVDAESYTHNHAVTEIELVRILKSAKTGDELIIDPEKAEQANRRAFIITDVASVPQFEWFYTGLKKKDGC